MTSIFQTYLNDAGIILLQKIAKNLRIAAALSVIIFPSLILNHYIDNDLTDTIFSGPTNNSTENATEDVTRTVFVKKGDNLASILKRESIPDHEIRQITNLTHARSIASKLKIGQAITFEYATTLIENEQDDLTQEQKSLNRIHITIDASKSLEFVRENDIFLSNYITLPLNKLITKYETTVDSNVIGSLKKAGLSTNGILKLISAFSHQLDFQRQIHKGDKIIVISEKYINSEGKFSHHGRIIHATIETKSNNYSIYNYSPNDNNNYEFFSEEGQTIKSTLLRTPVNVTRISSHYGYRKKHPVLGYGAMHRGVDFSAPTGTPIYSAGDGVVSFIGWKSGYGKFIVIKHSNTLSTAYGHASKFAVNLQKGSKVKQSDVIAYVGATGNTTGAHLHYEVILNGKQINPTSFKSLPATQLAGDKLRKFNKFKKHIKQLGNKLTDNIDLAAAEIKDIKL